MTGGTYKGVVSVIVDDIVMFKCPVIGQQHYNRVVVRLMETFTSFPYQLVSDFESLATVEKETISETLNP